MMTDDFESDLKELSSAEDFLDYFGISYDLRIVQVNRLHILQRFHDYLNDYDEMPDADALRFALHAQLLEKAYRDFVTSDARTEKVFRVLRPRQPQRVSIPLGNSQGRTDPETDRHARPI
ncbi:MAG: nitrogenase-stabilizing/protective protein NifW [Chromatiaceae bacterium]